MTQIISISLGAILINNFIFSQFLGICPFLGCSSKVDTATGMGLAVVFVMGLASAICWVIDQLKAHGYTGFIRMDTNGTGNLIHGRDICPELKGRIDTLSISLNSDNAKDYDALCHPIQGEIAYQAMLDFAQNAANYVPNVIFTIVDKDKTPEEIENCKRIAAERGVQLRIRSFIDS